ncbi:MAG: hypothetical protein IPP69_14225 [Flavobacteriales bacterium]|nr:hypothetical protein [Flavobacteriales bacterium]
MVTLSSITSGALYQWLDCNNNYEMITDAVDHDFVVTENGSYALEISLNGCIDTTDCELVMLDSYLSYDHKIFEAYPNPFQDNIKWICLATTFVIIYTGRKNH